MTYEKRVPVSTVMKNVMAILPGVDPADKRMLLVCGHYDSRVTDVMNTKEEGWNIHLVLNNDMIGILMEWKRS